MNRYNNNTSDGCNEMANFNISQNNLVDVMDNESWKKSKIDLFTIKYNGEPVDSNEIDADELATSLLGLSSTLEHANYQLNGENSRVFVKVRSSFKSGSFDVDIATFLTSTGITALVNITSLIGFTGTAVVGTLIWLFRRTKGKKIIEKKQTEGDNYEITVEGENNSITINHNVVALYENAQIRKDLANIVQPLKMPGMENITFIENGVEREKILKEETDYFSLIDTELINEKEDIDDFLITRSDFEGRQTGWRLSFGESESTDKKTNDFQVRILDEDFLKKVKQKEIDVHQGTIIRAKYKKTTQKVDKLSVAWEILQVLKVEYNFNLVDRKQKD